MLKYAVWFEGGTLFLGTSDNALSNTVMETSNDFDALFEFAKEVIADDVTDSSFPGGLIVLSEQLAA